ncbi:glycogen synthase (ADP-glucose) [Blastococcus sp. DSM 46786]|uniref:glycogen synthase n=1 Tax=Blastococcus sp. DSM 46786 TaxID=1798227 RepID=UPI0008D44050|nr:glycogen synthase [Blastococcus sp. DSM 46786]SEK79221.1 glycogen synthase (ADP-glucose) [Blastococcus sp. DSM 46786]
MRIGIVTREWPPDVYGGAGVHVEHLVAALRALPDGTGGAQDLQVDVHCFGGPRPDATAHAVPAELSEANGALQAVGVDVGIAAALAGVDLVHSHTWYANTAGLLASLVHGVPHVVTAHSLEPRRPWKAEQLGGGYRLSSWAERTAYLAADAVVAVSSGMREDVLAVYPELDPARVHVVRNGVDARAYRPVPAPDVVRRLGVEPDRPYALFVGRITRQKGLVHLLAAADQLPADAGLVLCAGAADTPAERQQVADAVAALQRRRDGVVWIEEMLPREQLVPLITGATVFVCPSVYEPLGIVNLEAAACGTAVVASAVGGIPEVVDDGRTGLLVPYDESDPAGFAAGLAARTGELLAAPDRAAAMGAAGRARVVADFGWEAIARQTVEVYAGVLAARR